MSQSDLFNKSERLVLPVEGGDLTLIRNIFGSADANYYFQQLRQYTPWTQDEIQIAGRPVKIPRLQAWYGDAGYSYSGLKLTPLPWTPVLRQIKAQVEAVSGALFNSVLVNLYRDGDDSVGWHSDDEPELGDEPVIASLSLGARRDFSLRQKKPGSGRLKLQLDDADLLVMGGALQHNWQHQLPKTRLPVGERINLTFRLVKLDDM